MKTQQTKAFDKGCYEALGILWKAFNFNKADIAKAADTSPQNISNMFKRGRISRVVALKLDGHERLVGILTKEQMRPDVKTWYGL